MSLNDALTMWAGTIRSFEEFCAAREHAWSNPENQVKAEAIQPKSRLLTIENGVAVLSIAGSLTHSDDWWVRWMGMTSYTEIREALAEAVENKEVSHIMMDINSPGGSVSGLADAADFVAKVDKAKPVYAFTDGVAASAAYWLMSSARKQYASSVATVGSIGVMAVHAETTRRDKENGVNYTIFRSGKYKALGHPKETLSDLAKAEMQERVDYLDNIFMEAVTDNLGMSMASAQSKIGDGREFIGEQALDVGLIDKVASFDDIYAMVAKKASKATNTTLGFAGVKMESNSEGEEPMKKKTLSAEALAAAAASGASLEDGKQPAEGAETSEAGDTQTSEDASATSSESNNTENGEQAGTVETEEAAAAAGTEEVPAEDATVTLLKSQLAEQTEATVDLKVQLQSANNELDELKASVSDLEGIAMDSVDKMSLALGHSGGSAKGMSGAQLVKEHARVAKVFQIEFKVAGVAITGASAEDENKGAKASNVTSLHSRRVKAASISSK